MATQSYTQNLYSMGGPGGLEVRPGARWSPDPHCAGQMIVDDKGHYVNNLVLMAANRQLLELHATKGNLLARIRHLEAEVTRLQGLVDTHPVMARAVLERLKTDPHATELFGFVRQLATLLSVEAA